MRTCLAASRRFIVPDAGKLANIFKVLAVDSRVKIVQLLKKKPLCVKAIAARLGLTPAAVSQHLRVLRYADLVKPQKRGYYVHYLMNEKTLAEWRRLTEELLNP